MYNHLHYYNYSYKWHYKLSESFSPFNFFFLMSVVTNHISIKGTAVTMVFLAESIVTVVNFYK